MAYQVLLFATLKEKLGSNKISLDIEEPLTVADLLSHLFTLYPQLQPYQKRILVAVNQNYASPTQLVKPEDEIALFPPVSGG
ncbi:MAG: molybdopterin converting factor subunit 1 [Anaerolineaceae bacterium]|jgi:molybdopterin synthase catalytic subunit|nr:molybdopterin converting factor subunit 1 [Anaerolineaceae bacterium]